MLGLRKREHEHRDGEETTESDKEWFLYKPEVLSAKTKWIDTLYGKLKLDEKEILYLNEFLQRYNMIDSSDDTILKILVPFALSRKDEFLCIQIPYQENREKHYVQHQVKILEKESVLSKIC
ncbi:MAG: hypothetical protein ACE5J2_05485 [Nitrososphaerales archaeon]